MNNIYKIAVLVLLSLLCLLVVYSGLKAHNKVLQVCPVNAISKQNNLAVIDSRKCINCGRCYNGIPNPVFREAKSVKQIVENDLVSSPPPPAADIPAPAVPTQNPAPPKKEKPAPATALKTFFKVNSEACIGCQLCVVSCPVNAISIYNGKAVIDAEKCTACGICASGNGDSFAGCPTTAISKVTAALPKTK